MSRALNRLSHEHLDDAERLSLALAERNRTVFEEGLARAAFSEQRVALIALLEEGFERLRQAGGLIATAGKAVFQMAKVVADILRLIAELRPA